MPLLSLDPAWEEEARIEQQHREWRAGYKVLMSDVKEGPKEILTGCPKLNPYQPHPKDPAALVNEFYPKRIVGTNFWDLDIRWSTDVDVSNSPLAMPTQVEVQSVKRTIPALLDAKGNPIVNIAGDMFTDPGAERQVTDLVFHVTKNVPLNLPSWVTTHPDCVNNDTLRIRGLNLAPGTLYFGDLAIGPEQNVPGATDTITTINGKSIPFCTVSFELHYRRMGWTLLIPNWGYFQLVPVKATKGKVIGLETNTSAGVPKRIRVRPLPFQYTRQRITVGPIGDYPPHPVFLDANGAAIINPTFGDIIILEFDIHEQKPFNLLPH